MGETLNTNEHFYALAYQFGKQNLDPHGELGTPWEPKVEPLDLAATVKAHSGELQKWFVWLAQNEPASFMKVDEDYGYWVGLTEMMACWTELHQQVPLTSYPMLPSQTAQLVFESLGSIRSFDEPVRLLAIKWLKHYLPGFGTMNEETAEAYVEAVLAFIGAENIDLLRSINASSPSSLSESYRKAIEDKLAEFASG